MRRSYSEISLGKKTVVIVGGGFAGLNAAKELSRYKHFHTILIDQKNHHLFQPLLYQVATSGLSPADIAVPIRSEFSEIKNVDVHLVKVDAINLDLQIVHILDSSWQIHYDYLILACGAQHSYFGHPEWEVFAPGLKTLEHAIEIRRRILLAFEEAENEFDPQKQESFLTFIVVGGGPTGVELAGAIADISKTVLVGDFKKIDPSHAKIILVEAGSRILSSFSEALSEKARVFLTELSVDVRLNSRVENINENGVIINSHFIASKSVFWAAGVQANKVALTQDFELDKAGRIKVKNDLSVSGFENVFVIGDMAAIEATTGNYVPGLAPAAIQQGRHAARVLLADHFKKDRPIFKYLDKGMTATIGRNRAVVQSGKFEMTGYLAWLAWLFIHLFYLVGFKNRITVMLHWTWSYLFSKRGARLIVEKCK